MKRTLLAVGIAVIVSTMLILIPFAVAQTMSSSPAARVKFKEFALYAP